MVTLAPFWLSRICFRSKGSDTITLQQMIEFINETQRDERLNEILYPFANKDSVTKLLDTYEMDENAKKSYKFTIAGFYRCCHFSHLH